MTRSLPKIARGKVRDPECLGLPRSAMPQVSVRESLKEFCSYLDGKKVAYHEGMALPESLKATQAELSVRKALRTPFTTRVPVVISSDNYVLDGHHRWLKWLLRRPSRLLPVLRVEIPVRELLELARGFAPPDPAPDAAIIAGGHLPASHFPAVFADAEFYEWRCNGVGSSVYRERDASFAASPRPGGFLVAGTSRADDEVSRGLAERLRRPFGPDLRDYVRDLVAAMPADKAVRVYRSLVGGGHDPQSAEEAGWMLHLAMGKSPRYEGEDEPATLADRMSRWEDGDRHLRGLLILNRRGGPLASYYAQVVAQARGTLDTALGNMVLDVLPGDFHRQQDKLWAGFDRTLSRVVSLRRDVEASRARDREFLRKMLKPAHPDRLYPIIPTWKDDTAADASCRSALSFLASSLTASPLDIHPLRIVFSRLGRDEPRRSRFVPLGNRRGRLVVREGESVDGVVHLLGHAVEFGVRGVRRQARRFLVRRTKKDLPIDMGSLPGCASMAGELGRLGDFRLRGSDSYYAGKLAIDHTEVVAVGLETLYRDPAGFADADPVYCKLILGLLKGALR